jgi:hypothetical protein
MTDQTAQDGQKTVVAFVTGLLVGGILVWIFNDTPAEAPVEVVVNPTEEVALTEEGGEESTDSASTETNEPEPAPAPALPTGEGDAAVGSTAAGRVVPLDGATFPTDEGWIGVRTYVDGQVTNILGAARYSNAQGLVPTEIELLTPTIPGREYAIVFFTENGDLEFNPAVDAPIDTPLNTFVAQ